jgi:hypothetical protein
MASKKAPAKPTMEQAFKSAQKTTSKKPVEPKIFGSAEESRAAVAVPFKAAYKFFKEGGISGQETPKVKPIPKAEKADLVTQARAKDRKANTSRMTKDAKYDGSSAKTTIGPVVPTSTTKTTTASTTAGPKATASTTAGPKAKPYTKLKQAPREAARRAFVQKRLEKLGIKPAAAGQPRSPEEKAARQKARATWDKKNKFQKKSPSNTSSAKAEMEAE